MVKQPVITMISCWYNDAKLAPFFLSHYSWADHIHILLDTDTTDGSLELLRAVPNAKHTPITYPRGFNDLDKTAHINTVLKQTVGDWAIIVDSDEFVYARGTDVRSFLARHARCRVAPVMFSEVYRHRTESDLDPTKPALPQRMHGNPKAGTSYGLVDKLWWYKPCVVNLRYGPVIGGGQHTVRFTHRGLSAPNLYGAHWCMADAAIATERRMAVKTRLTAKFRKRGWCIQHQHVTPASIIEECNRHLDDPVVIVP